MKNKESGFVIVMVLSIIVILSLIVASYFFITVGESASTKGSEDTTSGFYAAEGGLNLRAEAIRTKFNDRGQPSGASPTANTADDYCAAGGAQGSGDFACKTYAFSTANVRTYVEDVTAGVPISGTVPVGEEFEGMLYQGYQYDVFSTAYNNNNLPAAILQMRFTSRLVPLFQFAIFYDKDLEFSNTATLTVGGRVHTNYDLYLNAGGGGSTLTVNGLTTAVGQIYRGFKDQNACSGAVQALAIGGGLTGMNCASGGARLALTNALLNPWNGGIRQGALKLNVPKPAAFSPTPGAQYWDGAELRVVYDAVNSQVQVRDALNNIDAAATAILNVNCLAPTTGTTSAFYDRREGPSNGVTSGKFITMLEVNMGNLLTCINNNAAALHVPDGLANTSDNGLVLYFTVIGPNSNLNPSGYGVRLRNGNNLSPFNNTKGVTVVSDQPVYIQGDYNDFNNGAGWVPASVMGDVINVLSNNYANAASRNGAVPVTAVTDPNCVTAVYTVKGKSPLDCRPATSTTIRAAIVGATDSTGNAEGAAGRDVGTSNGGVNNMMRFHEEWGFNGGLQGGAATFTYQGSLVSLNTPLHMNGTWSLGAAPGGRSVYNPPIRNWTYDQRFNIAANLPPLSPQAVSLKQERFNRSFDRTTR
jgi:Tfp pilus assembly protein PilX